MKLKKCFCLLLTLSLSLQLFACAAPSETEKSPAAAKPVDLMASVVASPVSITETTDDQSLAAANFAVSLLQNTYAGENCIISPYSLYCALAMTANGADSETLSQMEDILGMHTAELNVYLYALAQNSSEELQSANSVWFRQEEGFSPNAEFLQINADFYGADIFSAAFDEKTLQELNNWISEKTGGRITEALKNIDTNTMMFLINALTFDAEWLTPYEENRIENDTFHALSGDEAAVMMHSEEAYFLDDGNAVGFMKPYLGERYHFVALLPNENLDDYISKLSGEALLTTVKNASEQTVFAAMPKYELEYSEILNDALSAMGMPNAFTAAADLSRMSNAELFISKVLHKTYLKVDEAGTQAGASSVVIADTKGVALNVKNVVLDRPFLMGIYDSVNECFIFLGAVESVAE